jgi:hypothetical protein
MVVDKDNTDSKPWVYWVVLYSTVPFWQNFFSNSGFCKALLVLNIAARSTSSGFRFGSLQHVHTGGAATGGAITHKQTHLTKASKTK